MIMAAGVGMEDPGSLSMALTGNHSFYELEPGSNVL